MMKLKMLSCSPLTFTAALLIAIGCFGIKDNAASAFSFVQEYDSSDVSIGGISPPPGGSVSAVAFSPSFNGAFDGSDLDGDGKLTCITGGSGCEITSFSSFISADIVATFVTAGGTISQQRIGNRVWLPPGGFDPVRDQFSLVYTLGDPTSLDFNYQILRFPSVLYSATGAGSSGNFRYQLGQGNLSITGTTSNSPLLVSGDSTAIPEPSFFLGLLFAGGAGMLLKWRRRSSHPAI